MQLLDGISQLTGATGEALRGIRKASGLSNDKDVMFYENLDPSAFEKMMIDYGQDNVLEYIRKMETKRMMEQS